jgi:ADP-heptose:LPS heptosyltransferase
MRLITILLGRIGDMILLTPFFELIKQKFPESQIEVIASRHNYIILKNNPNISKIHIYDKKINHTLQLILYLRLNQFDYYIDPKDHYSTESAIFSKIVRSKIKIGFNKKNSNNFNYPIEDVSLHKNLHFSQRLILPLKYLDINLPNLPLKPILFEDINSIKYVDEFIAKNELRKYIICCNLSASKINKMWQTEKWIKFFQNLSNSNKFNFVITFEPKHKIIAEEIKKVVPKVVLFNSRSIMDVVSLVKISDLILTPDTSIVHIAAAYNRPIIVLHSGLSETYNWFHPLSEINKTIFADDGIDELSSITVDSLVKEFNNMLTIIQNEEN